MVSKHLLSVDLVLLWGACCAQPLRGDGLLNPPQSDLLG